MRFGWAVALAAVAALLLAFGATTASPEGQIVVTGPASGTHLRLTVSGGDLVVEGSMSEAPPIGCGFARYHKVAVCPLAGAGGVELVMGPAGDMVRVLDKLPIPLTAHLGEGSDKFVGNGEPDTCYSEGARRNRCLGEGGDDICITGPENSDCVGGPGDDYCQTGAGSDGCWGGPGRDICRMGAGQDGCHGDGGEDQLFGGPHSDQLYGGPGYDQCEGLPGWGRSRECEDGGGR